jgi:hypothetical protein
MVIRASLYFGSSCPANTALSRAGLSETTGTRPPQHGLAVLASWPGSRQGLAASCMAQGPH